jgi:hypothetical protein
MQTKTNKLSITSYLDFAQLLEVYRGNHEENRLFALKYKSLDKNPIKMLLLWAKEHRFHLTQGLNSKAFVAYIGTTTQLLAFLFLLIGFLTGLGLLSYSGDAPVNITYYLFFAMVVPLLSMLLSLFTMFSRGGVAEFFSLFLSLHWLDKLVALLPLESKKTFSKEILLPDELTKWMMIERMQRISLLFSIGLVMALIFVVVVKDIAFGWSTTLDISATSFHSFISTIALFWKDIVPSAVPSLELIEISQYFRLGERLDKELVANANQLGAWWQFLAMATVFYAIILRFLFWIFSYYGYKKILQKELLSMDGVATLLREFNTPFVSTEATQGEKHLEIVEENNLQVQNFVRKSYQNVLGWNFSKDEILLANDSKEITCSTVASVGGSNTFLEDENEAKSISRTALLYVKSWEPPTMDFVDFLELLIENRKVDTIHIYPLGTVGRYYESDAKDISVWKRKVQGLKSEKVWIIDD